MHVYQNNAGHCCLGVINDSITTRNPQRNDIIDTMGSAFSGVKELIFS